MWVYERASACYMWPFWVFSLISLFNLSTLSSLHFLACPEAQQLVSVLPLSLSPMQCWKWGDRGMCGVPEWLNHRTIPEISLNLHLRFHLPQGDRGIEGGIYAIAWQEGGERKTAVVRISDFPCRIKGREAGRLDVALVTTGVHAVCVGIHTQKHNGGPSVSARLPMAYLSLSENIKADIVINAMLCVCVCVCVGGVTLTVCVAAVDQTKPRERHKSKQSKTSIKFRTITWVTCCAAATRTCLHQRKGYCAVTAAISLSYLQIHVTCSFSVKPNMTVWSNKLSMQGGFFP